MSRPIRLQLSRKAGFRLQEASLAANGLPAVNVARPTKWGNPFTPDGYWAAGYPGSHAVAIKHCVDAFRSLAEARGHWAHGIPQKPLPDISPLRGKNLACWCSTAPGTPCHADVLLDLANRPTCEAVPE